MKFLEDVLVEIYRKDHIALLIEEIFQDGTTKTSVMGEEISLEV